MSDKKKFEIHKVKDKFGVVRREHATLFPLPFKLLICGKSMLSAKSSLIVNLLLKEEGYKNMFKGENIYIINPSSNIDSKFEMIKRNLDIPSYNIFTDYDEGIVTELYNDLEEQGLEELEEHNTIFPKLIIMDDVAADNVYKSKQAGVMSKLMFNSRHFGCNLILTSQKYSTFSTAARENATAIAVSSCSNKQLELIEQDNNIISKKQFNSIFRKATNEPFTWFFINYHSPAKDRFLDTNFNVIPIDLEN
jgi:hypothetical protein